MQEEGGKDSKERQCELFGSAKLLSNGMNETSPSKLRHNERLPRVAIQLSHMFRVRLKGELPDVVEQCGSSATEPLDVNVRGSIQIIGDEPMELSMSAYSQAFDDGEEFGQISRVRCEGYRNALVDVRSRYRRGSRDCGEKH